MTRKDYQALAAAFREAMRTADGNTAYRAGVEQARWEVMRVLRGDNGRFDADRFLAACEPSK